MEKSKELQEFFYKIGKAGGKARAKKYSRKKIREWGRMGGRQKLLTDEQVAEIVVKLKAGTSQAEVAKMYSVSASTVCLIWNRQKKKKRNNGHKKDRQQKPDGQAEPPVQGDQRSAA